jgi:hypothetical protein
MITCIFDLTDSSGHQLYTRLHVTPVCHGFNYSGSIISADAIIVHESGSQVSMPLVPNSYAVRLYGRNNETQFNISLPTASDYTTISAANYIVNWLPDDCNQTASYALFAGTASYALYAANGGGGGGGSGSVQVYNGTGAYPATPPTVTTSPALWYSDTGGNGLPALYYWSNQVNDWVSMIN